MLNLGTRRTKIVCTIGPATQSEDVITKLIDAGMNVARINFSHGTAEQHEQTINTVRRIARDKNIPVAILQDLSGPKIRIGLMKAPVNLVTGAEFVIYKQDRVGDVTGASCSYPELVHVVEPGDTILLADGAINLKVLKRDEEKVICRVVEGGMLSSHKGINLPDRTLPLPSLTEKDRQDLQLGIKLGVDYVALSFVRRPEDVLELKNLIDRAGLEAGVIAKIEKHEALDAIDEIIAASDGIMVARGDLAVEIPLERVPIEQKMIIQKSNQTGRPVITATQMLKSMVEQSRPTRAEAADVANAVLDGTDAVMLSEETAVGRFPVETVQTMHRILVATEQTLGPKFLTQTQRQGDHITVPAAVSHAAVIMARDLQASAIMAPTRSGATARMISRYRPMMPIVALCTEEKVRQQLSLVWGVYPYKVEKISDTDSVFQLARETALQNGFVKPGQMIITTAGMPLGTRGTTNLIKVEELEE